MIMQRLHHLDNATLRAIALVCLAVGIVGVSYGSLAVSWGFPVWFPVLTALIVLAGASEFMFIAIIAAGGSPIAAALAGLLVNARHFPFGIAVRGLVGQGMVLLLGSHIMNDESVVFGLSQPTQEKRQAAFWLCGTGVAVIWPLGALLGALVGKILPDPQTIGLDAVFPAILLALVVPAFKSKVTLTRASIGAALTLVAVPFVPVGMPVLLSLAGLVAGRKKS